MKMILEELREVSVREWIGASALCVMCVGVMVLMLLAF